ncbi:MAG TPA: hypothetical protein VFF86_04160 [Candidatus Methylomirabilis sp.]|nr:hypothetical protein [Candidatus Methylomirabilis sp.]
MLASPSLVAAPAVAGYTTERTIGQSVRSGDDAWRGDDETIESSADSCVLPGWCLGLYDRWVHRASVPSQHPLGYTLPPDAPQLYDNEVFARFVKVRQRPFQVHGVKLAPWLIAHVLDEAVRGNAMGREATEPVLLVHRVGYVTDTRNQAYGRILALVDTLIDPATQHRMIRFWVDQGWVTNGEATGRWSPWKTTSRPASREEAKGLMEPAHLLVAAGYVQYAKSHGLPAPTIPVVPVKSERHRQAMR